MGLVSLDDFATYLSNPGLDPLRALFILDLAQEKCETIVSPLPPAARSVVLDVAERAYANPLNTNGVTTLYAEGEGPFSDVSPGTVGGGVYLTKANKADLRRAAGSGTAFSIDMLPATLGTLPPWDDGGDEAALLNLP